jgi:hypothetical protein
VTPTTNNTINAAVAGALALAAKAHFWHLTTGSYAAHVALRELYDLAHSIADGLSEAAQGEGFDHSKTSLQVEFVPYSGSLAIGAIENFCGIELGKVLMTIQGAKDLDWLANIVQGFQGDIYKILYKLKKLS